MAEIVPPENTTELPARLRVHALAKLLGVTSKDVIAQLDALGAPAKSVQSSVDRDVAEQVRTALRGAGAAVTGVLVTESPAPEIPVADAPAPDVPEVVAPLFMAPEPAVAPRRRRASRAAAAPDEPAPAPAGPTSEPAADPGQESAEEDAAAPVRGRRRRAARAEPPADDQAGPADSAPAPDAGASATEPEQETAGDDDEDDGAPKRRRRGRRGRGRGRGPSADEQGQDDDESGAREDTDGAGRDRGVRTPTQDGADDSAGDGGPVDDSAGDGGAGDGGAGDGGAGEDDESDAGSRRRRRRRRRSSGGSSDSGDNSNGGGAQGGGAQNGGEADPPNTVVHEREPRSRGKGRGSSRGDATDEVQGITGSTRLEAKRQRRRDGRDAGRRRPPILSEAEFLARREAVDRTMVVRQNGVQTQVAVLEDDVLVEHFVTSASSNAMAGNIYLGRVQNVLPSMEAAFIDVGRGRNGVLYAGEVDWDAAGLGGRSRKIEQALHSGDLVLVQVSKDPVGHKGARLTTQISLPGRFLVYVPAGGSTGISRKLPDTERTRLKAILKRIVPADAGVIVRTASEGVSESDLAADVQRLQAQWEVISTRAAEATAAATKSPVALYEEPDLLVKVVRDLFNEDFRSLVVSGSDVFDTVDGYVRQVAPDLAAKVRRYTDDTDVFTTHRVHEQLAKAMDRKVWLPSGGTLVIDRTEAMTVVDVNTGKFTGAGGNLEETVTRNNIEAAEEIVRQMRLRDIGGMIVVDFIDMVLESNRDLVLRRLTECLGRDRTRHQVSEVTSLGLVQMTRKRVGAGLIEEFSVPCEHCQGRGVLVQGEPVTTPGGGGRGDSAGRGDSGINGESQRRGRGGRGAKELERPAKEIVDLSSVVPETPSTPPLPGPRRRGASAPAQTVSPAADAVLTEPAALEPAAAESAVPESVPEPTVPEPTVLEPTVPKRSRARRASRPTAAPVAAETAETVVVVAPIVEETPAAPAAEEPPAAPAAEEPAPPVRKARARRASRAVAAPEVGQPPSPVIAVVPATVPDAPAAEPARPEAPAGSGPVTRPPRRAAGRPAGPPPEAAP